MVREILERLELSVYEAHAKTGVHYTTIHRMLNGVIPSEDTIDRFTKGLGEDPEPLLVEAGFAQPSDIVEAVRVCLRTQGELPPEAIEEVAATVEEIKAKYQKK
jgi:hypothetical protein